jgi:hypothetical protein
VIIFGLVRFLSKKLTKPKFFLKKTETGSNRFGLVFPVRLGFSGSARFFRFGLVFFCSVFWFFAYKTETRPASFFKILIGLIGFFFDSVFLVFFFFSFLNLINFLVFFSFLDEMSSKGDFN